MYREISFREKDTKTLLAFFRPVFDTVQNVTYIHTHCSKSDISWNLYIIKQKSFVKVLKVEENNKCIKRIHCVISLCNSFVSGNSPNPVLIKKYIWNIC